MEALTLSTFIKAADDDELSKYKVLAILNRYSEALHRNKLYPALAELISIKNELELLVEQMSLFDPEFVLNLNFADFSEDLPLTNPVEYDEYSLKKVSDFIDWALPEIKTAINEGKAIFDFVDENITLNEIGIMPIYKNEGYFLLPDIKHELMKIYRFEMSLFSTEENPLRTLKSKLVDLISLNTPEANSPYEIKHNLIKKYPDLPNPSTYCFNSSIDFPFVETILPVAKRKLVRVLATA
ncbi:MAG: hypothetical protein KDC88_02780 [Ignavibacteriae bacterium]|nr:hypothetical protein [Ignavibacteriota bacterium]MCB9207877.1 hypothetical protein [Ignavibacteriales bacterium]MCB9258646.1 hypothetical protein [Ignavibacteriales bacterium]